MPSHGPGGTPAIFLDRDGTINKDTGYISMAEDFHFLPHAIRGLQYMVKLGYPLFIVTNQSGIARGYFEMSDVDAIHALMCERLEAKKVSFEAIYVSPDLSNSGSATRKPEPAFLFQAAEAFNLDLTKSWMIGDKVADCQCGHNAGARCIQIRGQYEIYDDADYHVDNLVEAADVIAQQGDR